MLENKINIDDVAVFLDEKGDLKPAEVTRTHGDKTITYHIGRFMTAEEKANFVQKVCDACFIEDEYHPEFYDIAFGVTLMQMLTDIPAVEAEDDKGNKIIDVDKTYAIYVGLKVEDAFSYEILPSDIYTLYGELRYSTDEAIKFRRDRIIANEKKQIDILKKELDDGIALLNASVDKMIKQNESVMKSEEFKKTAKLADKLENISEEEVVKVLSKKNSK